MNDKELLEHVKENYTPGYGVEPHEITYGNYRLSCSPARNTPAYGSPPGADLLHHPFCVTPKHVEIASDRYSGMLGKEACRAAPCGICGSHYDDHESDKILMVRRHPDVPDNKLGLALFYSFGQELVDFCQEHNIEGFGFPTDPNIAAPTHDPNKLQQPG